jgi:hypothetical protein
MLTRSVELWQYLGVPMLGPATEETEMTAVLADRAVSSLLAFAA